MTNRLRILLAAVALVPLSGCGYNQIQQTDEGVKAAIAKGGGAGQQALRLIVAEVHDADRLFQPFDSSGRRDEAG